MGKQIALKCSNGFPYHHQRKRSKECRKKVHPKHRITQQLYQVRDPGSEGRNGQITPGKVTALIQMQILIAVQVILRADELVLQQKLDENKNDQDNSLFIHADASCFGES